MILEPTEFARFSMEETKEPTSASDLPQATLRLTTFEMLCGECGASSKVEHTKQNL